MLISNEYLDEQSSSTMMTELFTSTKMSMLDLLSDKITNKTDDWRRTSINYWNETTEMSKELFSL